MLLKIVITLCKTISCLLLFELAIVVYQYNFTSILFHTISSTSFWSKKYVHVAFSPELTSEVTSHTIESISVNFRRHFRLGEGNFHVGYIFLLITGKLLIFQYISEIAKSKPRS